MSDKTKIDVLTAFSSGEFTPSLAGRVDLQDYKFGSRFVENFIPEVQGGLKKFYGTKKIGSIGTPDRSIMVPFDGADQPIILVLHDGVVSVVDDENFYDLDISINVGEYYNLNWQQNNDIIFFAQQDTMPFAIKYKGRDENGKCVFEQETIEFVDVPYFPIGWSGNYNGVVKTDGDSGTVTVTMQTQVEGRLYLPDFLKNISGDKNVISPTNTKASVAAYRYDNSHHTYNYRIGATNIEILRYRGGATTVLSTVSIGSIKTAGVDHLNSNKYKTINRSGVLNAVRSYLPSAQWDAVNNYIYFTDSVPDHQSGDEYAIRISQDASSTNGPNQTISGYTSKSSWSAWSQTGSSYEPVLPSASEWDDENIVGRKIKFMLETENAVIYSWIEGENVTSGDVRYSDGNYYQAMDTGTCGEVQPIHHEGIHSDGKISWKYLHSGYATATVVSVTSATELKATVDGYLPVLTPGQAEYSWSNYQWSIWGYKQVYPSQVFFFKGRLGYFCSTAGYGCWFSASNTDDYYNFATEKYGQVLDTCAINILVTGHNDNNVNWVMSGDRLYCGSYAGEYNILGDGVSISPTACMVDPITNVGGAPVRPVRFYGLNLFVGRAENEIYSIAYDYTTDDYSPDNIGFMSAHLLEEKVVRWVVLPNIDRNIYFTTKDKNLRVINYVKELKNLGYFRINVEADVKDVATSCSGSRSIMYITTVRNGEHFIEKVMSETPNYMLFEHTVILESLEPVTFTDLAGQDVWVKDNLTGQFYEANIGDNGEFDNEREWLNFSIGLPMTCTIHGQACSGEKLEGLQQKSVRFIVRLKNSGDFSYGSSVDFSKVYHYNSWNILNSQEWNSAHKLMTGDIQLPSSFGYTVGQNTGTGVYPNDTGVGLNLFANTPEPFTLLSISSIYV